MPGPVMMKQTPGLAADPGIAVGHEAGTLLVTRRDVPDPCGRQAAVELDRVHARDAEHRVDPVALEHVDESLAAGGHLCSSQAGARMRSRTIRSATCSGVSPVAAARASTAAVMSRIRSTEAKTASGRSSIASWWKSITPPALAR